MPGDQDVVVFEVGGVRYGIPSAQVRELTRAVTIVPLPSAPAIVEGIINVRGTLVPVLDIRTRFRLPPKAPSYTDHLIVAEAGTRLVAVRADRAVDLTRIGSSEIDQIGAAVPGAGFISGVAKVADGMVLIHDLRTFLQDAEAATLDGAIAAVADSGAGS